MKKTKNVYIYPVLCVPPVILEVLVKYQFLFCSLHFLTPKMKSNVLKLTVGVALKSVNEAFVYFLQCTKDTIYVDSHNYSITLYENIYFIEIYFNKSGSIVFPNTHFMIEKR